MSLTALETRLQYRFNKPALLRQALTHRSHSGTHNERLEFLGDSVLNCVVATLLFQRYTALDEGDMSRVRANLVRQQTLYELAQSANLAEYLQLGEGELKSGGMKRPSILADALEAVVGAIYLDGGFVAAEKAIGQLYQAILADIDPLTLGKDAKTLLQERLQGSQMPLPQYTVVATLGAAHNQHFEVECVVPGLEIRVQGAGTSRRAAEQAAAQKALDRMTSAVPNAGVARRGHAKPTSRRGGGAGGAASAGGGADVAADVVADVVNKVATAAAATKAAGSSTVSTSPARTTLRSRTPRA